MIKTSPIKDLLLKLEGKIPDDLLEEVNDYLYEQEEELRSKDQTIDELSNDVVDLEDKLKEAEDRPDLGYDDVEEWLEYKAKDHELESLIPIFQDNRVDLITIPNSLDVGQSLYGEKLQEYIMAHGCEDTYNQLTQDHSQEVEELRNTVEDLRIKVYGLEADKSKLELDLELYAQL